MLRIFKKDHNNYTTPGDPKIHKTYYEIGEEYVCENFNDENLHGFFATNRVENLINQWQVRYPIDRICVEVEVSGKSIKVNDFKRRYEKMKLLRIVPVEELVERAKMVEGNLDYKLSEVINPFDPTKINPPEINQNHIDMLRLWSQILSYIYHSHNPGLHVKPSIWNILTDTHKDALRSLHRSLGCSNGCDIGDSIKVLVLNSVWSDISEGSLTNYGSCGGRIKDSIENSTWAYIGSLFENISHTIVDENSEYLYQCGADLYKEGLIPSFYHDVWRLHGGKDMEILFEIDEQELNENVTSRMFM